MRHLAPILILCVLLASSCRAPKTIIDTRYIYDTTYVGQKEYVYVKDSVSVKEKGDTVYIIKYKYEIRHKHDTVYTSKVDSVFVPSETEYIEKELTWWEKFRLEKFNIVAIGFLLLLVWTLRKPIFTLIKRI